ncbi:aspartate/glutamate racemase family protein [Croceivirga thetidis]|uniref:Amino acid racemase n=1 Tax=Croceivirga thetidis TaxID=2721623 RepID=A0ABX1GP83_9FLAO|nr:amino acid racemase [Croceivirga thetidis]NKI31439.1 amino acid racemase [Croceivirga thetidis]
MKTIGLIGGLTWQSSKFYYDFLNQLVVEKMGGSHSAKILMSSVDFAPIEKLSFENNWTKIGELMAIEAKRLENAGADLIIIGSNTINMVSDYVTAAISIPFVHIADATGNAIKKIGLSKVGLLGTKFTMERDFYKSILKNSYGLEVLIPNEKERDTLQYMIYNELAKGDFSESSKNKCLDIIGNLISNGAQGIILGCTELPILIPEGEIPVHSFDTTMIHSRAAVEAAINSI